MIKVILPNNYKNFTDDLTDEVIKKICKYSLGQEEFFTELENRSKGRYIILELDGKRRYICVSAKKEEGRNSLTVQYIVTAYGKYIKDMCEDKKIEIFMLYTEDGARNEYQKFAYRMYKTLGIEVLNIDELSISSILPFDSYKEFKEVRTRTRESNSGNQSSFFADQGNYIEFWGKVYGANGKESALMCLALEKITNKKIKFYRVQDHNTDRLSQNDIETLQSNNIEIADEVKIFENNDIDINSSEENLRDTPKYHYNLFKKFGENKKCYLCDCDIERLIIGSHIHRVTDIKKSDLSREEKIKEIIDGDNGFWLCANHDKLFEYGLIYFEGRKLVISERLNELQKEFVNKITFEVKRHLNKTVANAVMEEKENYYNCNFYIKKEDYNENMHKYLELHRNRVNR